VIHYDALRASTEMDEKWPLQVSVFGRFFGAWPGSYVIDSRGVLGSYFSYDRYQAKVQNGGNGAQASPLEASFVFACATHRDTRRHHTAATLNNDVYSGGAAPKHKR